MHDCLRIVSAKTTSRTVPVIRPEGGKPFLIEGIEYLDSREAAHILHLRPERVAAYIASGLLPASKVGRKYLIRKDAVLAFIESNAVTPKSA